MDKDEVKGKVKQAEGRVEKAAGDLTGSEKTKAKGSAKIAEGKVQAGLGKAKDTVKKAIDKV